MKEMYLKRSSAKCRPLCIKQTMGQGLGPLRLKIANREGPIGFGNYKSTLVEVI